MKSKRESISESVRRLIRESGLTEYQISQLTGVDKAALSRFTNKKVGLTLNTLDRLAEVLGWELVARRAKSKAIAATSKARTRR